MFKIAIASAFALAAQAATLNTTMNSRIEVAGESRSESATLTLGQTVELCYPQGHDHMAWTYAVGQDSNVLTVLPSTIIKPAEGLMGAPTTICAKFGANQEGSSLIVFSGKDRKGDEVVIDYTMNVQKPEVSNDYKVNPVVQVEVAKGYGTSVEEHELTMKSIFKVCWNDQHDSTVYNLKIEGSALNALGRAHSESEHADQPHIMGAPKRMCQIMQAVESGDATVTVTGTNHYAATVSTNVYKVHVQ